jgi:hypothetical protein
MPYQLNDLREAIIHGAEDDDEFSPGGPNRHIACSLDPIKDNWEGSLCVFIQYTNETLTGRRIKHLMSGLVAHGCKRCGSIPITWPESNDPRNGILTANFVNKKKVDWSRVVIKPTKHY